MIHSSTNYGSVEVYSLLEFGKGDIKVVNGSGDDHVCVLFRNDKPNTVGQTDSTNEWRNSDEFMPDVVMTFNNPGSIDVVIEMLNRAKQNLLAPSDR